MVVSPRPSSHPVPSLLPPSPADRWAVGQVRTVKRAFTLRSQSPEDQSSRPVGGDEPTEYLRRQSPPWAPPFWGPKSSGWCWDPAQQTKETSHIPGGKGVCFTPRDPKTGNLGAQVLRKHGCGASRSSGPGAASSSKGGHSCTQQTLVSTSSTLGCGERGYTGSTWTRMEGLESPLLTPTLPHPSGD